MSTTLNALQKQRRDTAANWTTANPTLLAGEIGIESDTSKIKIGDGSTAWNSLGYTPWSQVSAYPIVNADVASNAEIAVSKLADGTARQLLQTDAAGTGVEWTSNVDVPGTLDVTGAATFDNNVTIQGDLTVNGTTTTIDTTNLAIEDKNIEIGKVATPTDVTADGGGITLKGTTDKTINWVDATDAWTLSEHVNIASGKEYRINGTKVLDATSLGSGVLITSSNITDGTIVNADINASAAIAGTKISPDFGSQNTTTTGTVTGASLIPSSSTAPSNGVYLPAANTVGISTASTERIRIGSAGQIGIGGANYGTSGQVLTSNGSGAAPSWQSSVSQWTTSGSNIYYSTGSVGIGSSNPQNPLVVSNGGANGFEISSATNSGTTNYLLSYNRSTSAYTDMRLDASAFRFEVSATERMRLTSTGLGINTASPSEAFTLGSGNAQITSGQLTVGVTSTSGLQFINDGTFGTLNSIPLVLRTASAERVRIDTSGRVGVGNSAPQALIHAGRATSDVAVPTGNFAVIRGGDYGTPGTGGIQLSGGYGDNGRIGAFNIKAVGSGAGAGTFVNDLLFTTTASFSGTEVERMRLDSSGRLGIGTGSPSSYDFNGPAVLAVANTAGSSTLTIASDASSLGQIAFADGTSSTARYRGLLEYNHLTDSLQIRTAAIPAITVDSSQRVGIGSTTFSAVSGISGAKLQVLGGAIIGNDGAGSNGSGWVAFDSACAAPATTKPLIYHRQGVGLGLLTDAGISFEVGANEAARIDSSRRLLVGTSSSRSGWFNNSPWGNPTLQVEGTSVFNSGISVTNNSNDDNGSQIILGKSRATSVGGVTVVSSGDNLGRISFQGADGSELVAAATIECSVDATPGNNDMPGRLVFSVTADGASSPTEAMRISNNRNVRFGTSGTSYGMFDINNDGSSTYKLEYTNVSSTRVFGVTSGGIVESKGSFDSSTVSAANVFINASTYQLQRSISSIKYKKDVETIEDRYSDALLQCRPVWYRSKCENDNPAWGHWGFIAEEVAEIDPRLCHYGKDENGADVIESVQYDRFVPHLLNLIKRQQQAIEALEARISALEAQ